MAEAKHNFTEPTYGKMFSHVFETAKKSWSETNAHQCTISAWFELMSKYASVQPRDVFYVVVLAVFWTALRHFVTSTIFKVCNDIISKLLCYF